MLVELWPLQSVALLRVAKVRDVLCISGLSARAHEGCGNLEATALREVLLITSHRSVSGMCRTNSSELSTLIAMPPEMEAAAVFGTTLDW